MSLTPELGEAITELARLKAESKEIGAAATEYEFLIKQAMGECESIVDADGKPVVTWKNRKSRRIDTTRLKRENPDLYDEFCAETVSRTFTIK